MNCQRKFIDGKHCRRKAQKDTYWMTFPVCNECHAQLKYRIKSSHYNRRKETNAVQLVPYPV